jgi:hypothetical protein
MPLATPRLLRSVAAAAVACAALLAPLTVSAAELVSVRPLTDRILMLHFDEGHVEYHNRGQPRSADIVHISPLDTAAASAPATYTLASPEDPAFRSGKSPVSVGRKSKGMEFAWFADSMVNGKVVNKRPDQIREHWLYLELPAPLTRHQTYTLQTGDLATNGREWTFTFLEPALRSEAVHVNALGYLPGAPQKFGYLYAWMGDKGPLDLKAHEGKPFHLIDTATGKPAFTGTIAFRKPRTQQETHQVHNTPGGNFLGADVWECDFSAFNTPGTYTLTVAGIGSSWPFRIAADVYRDPYYHVIRSLYHNRSGIELKQPHTTFVRPAPHNPKLTPGFENRLFYTTVRFTEWGSEGGERKTLDAGRKGNLTETWGWYQDAGDWDGYPNHLRPAFELLLTYETHPAAFPDGQLDLPESGNGVPDLIDEAAWLPRYAHRLRHELLAKGWGTGGVSLRVAGDAYGPDEKVLPDGKRISQGSWEDVGRDWMVAGEDPWSTYRYAAIAAQLAHALKIAGVPDPEGVDWTKEAVESYAWAKANTRPGDEGQKPREEMLADTRLLASAALFRLTGEATYEQQFRADADDILPRTVLGGVRLYAAALYALGGGPAAPDATTLRTIRSALLASADEIVINTPAKRALRWGGNFGMPMLVGQQTTPWVLEGVVGYALTRESDPAKARAYLGGLATTADYFLGTNPENRVYITGVGPRSAVHIFHMDAWYLSEPPVYPPGLIPYAHWFKDTQGNGPWDRGWPHHTVHPAIDEWPGAERYFPNRCSPMGSEFTIHQQSGPAAAIYGFLHALGQTATP